MKAWKILTGQFPSGIYIFETFKTVENSPIFQDFCKSQEFTGHIFHPGCGYQKKETEWFLPFLKEIIKGILKA